jgi:septal ring factor EnvC (AmiA/AmiB activator)
MKRLFIFLSILFVFSSMLTGCMSTGFLGFLATTDSVEARIAEQDAAMKADMDRQQARLDGMAKDLRDLQTMKEDASKAIDQAAQSKKTVEELKATIARLEARLEALPEQSLRMLIDILQASLEQAEQTTPTEQEKK